MIIKKDDLWFLINSLIKKYEVFAPVGERFEKIASADEITFDKTTFSAKKLFLPSREELFSFRKDKINIKIESKKRILFGVRPCDLNALLYLDKIFVDDPYYASKRENTILLGIQCTKPFKHCYCHLTNSFETTNYDLLFIESKNDFFIDIGSEKGKELVENLKKVKRIGKEKTTALMDQIRQNFLKKGTNKLHINDKVILKFAADCFNCAACTSVCPSCYCFSIEDELNYDLESGRRVRMWDSCQLQRFTRVAEDFIFRPERFQRMKQMIYCKFDYSKKNHGMLACTGCGRCVDVCTKKINIFEVFK